jgi:hypothetical protein
MGKGQPWRVRVREMLVRPDVALRIHAHGEQILTQDALDGSGPTRVRRAGHPRVAGGQVLLVEERVAVPHARAEVMPEVAGEQLRLRVVPGEGELREIGRLRGERQRAGGEQ